MRKSISITERLILNFLLLSLAAITIIGVYSFFSSRSAIMLRTYDHLTSVRTAKKEFIESFFNARISEVKLISRSAEVRHALENLNQEEKIGEQTLIGNHGLFQLLAQDSNYNFLYVISPNGHAAQLSLKDKKLIFKGIDDTAALFPRLSEIFRKLPTKQEIAFCDFRQKDSLSCRSIIISSPVFSPDSIFSGYVVLAVSQLVINNIMLENDPADGMGNSGEAYLVGPDYLMRSQSRFLPHSVMHTEVRSPAVTDALNGGSGTLRMIDYRGIDVLNSHSALNIPGLNWTIMAEIDYQEAMIPLTDLRNKILFLTIFIAIVVFISIYVVSRNITRPIIRLKDAAEKIGKGDFNTSLRVERMDEIGALTLSFNQMSEQLKIMTDELKEREEHLMHFYEATLDGILLHDDETILLVNQALCNLTGFSEDELKTMKVTDVFSQEKSSSFRYPLKPYSYETIARKKNGTTFPVEIQVSVIEYRNKMILASIIRDITRRMEVENELRQERLKRLSWVIDGQEIERERFSRELHDGLGQWLVAIKLKLESGIEPEDEKTLSVIRELRAMFDKTIDEVRRISNDLMPSGLQEFGLVNGLRKLGSVVSDNSGIKVSVDADHIPEGLKTKTIMYLYRIAQEAINNSVKHAGASEIHVKLAFDEQFITLEVMDNGKGFKFDKTHKFVGNGIYNMRERVNMMNGILDIQSTPGSGTNVKVMIPIMV